MTILTLFRTYPIRIVRLIFHFLQWIPVVRRSHLPSKGLVEWFMDLGFYLVDIFVIPDFLEFIFAWIQPQNRFLNEEEKIYVKKYFKNKIHLQNVRISFEIPERIKHLAIAFATFHTIHYSKKITIPIFIHEMVHVWQYQKFGSVYIFRALKAQRSEEGYDYGGLENLYVKMLNSFVFTQFNFEQQAEIFEDYCRMRESENLEKPLAIASFEYFVGQVRDSGTV